MLKPIINSYKLTTCQLLYLTNTYKPREILLTIRKLYFLNFCWFRLVKYDCHLYTIEAGIDAVINLGIS